MKGLEEWKGFNSRGFAYEQVRKLHFQLTKCKGVSYVPCIYKEKERLTLTMKILMFQHKR